MEHANQYLPSHKISSSCVKDQYSSNCTGHNPLCIINILVQFHLAFLTAKRNCFVAWILSGAPLDAADSSRALFFERDDLKTNTLLHHLILFSDLLITLRTKCPRYTHWIYVVYGTWWWQQSFIPNYQYQPYSFGDIRINS